MNCEKLNTQIKELEEGLKNISEQVEEFSRSEEVEKKKLQVLDGKVAELEVKRDVALEAHMGEFFSRFPELMTFSVGKEIIEHGKGFTIFKRLSDSEVLVKMLGSEARILRKDTVNGQEYWRLEEEISASDVFIHDPVQLSDSAALVMEEYSGEIGILKKDVGNGQGRWKYESKIAKFGEKIETAVRLSDSEVLMIGKKAGILKEHTENGQERWEYEGDIPGYYGGIWASGHLSDSEVLAMGTLGKTLTFEKRTEDGQESWKYGGKIAGFFGTLRAFVKLSDSEVLIMNNDCKAKVLRRRTINGRESWRYDEDVIDFGKGLSGFGFPSCERLSDSAVLMASGNKIKILARHVANGRERWGYRDEEISGFQGNIKAFERLSDSEIFVICEDGETRILTITEGDFEGLKKNLGKIVERKRAR